MGKSKVRGRPGTGDRTAAHLEQAGGQGSVHRARNSNSGGQERLSGRLTSTLVGR